MPDQDPRLQPLLDRVPAIWGKEVRFRSGWNDLVVQLDADLAKIDPDYEIHQMKEKFGGLRFYAETSIHFKGPNTSVRDFRDLISTAQAASYGICETCGAKDASTLSSWEQGVRTICPRCDNGAD